MYDLGREPISGIADLPHTLGYSPDRAPGRGDRAQRSAMAEASRAVLGGFELGTDAHVVRYPGRYQDTRGKIMWERVSSLMLRASGGAEARRA